MPTPHMQTFKLMPHPGEDESAVRSIFGKIVRTPGELLVSYVLEGDLERLRVPEGRTPRFTDELWRHTCFEMFVARENEAEYHEFNFSPSGEWAAYAFVRYRERVPVATGMELTTFDPQVTVLRSAGKIELDAVARLDRLPPLYADGRIVLGLSAVVESHDSDSLSYWALKHALAKPDFHHPDGFTLTLDEIRN